MGLEINAQGVRSKCYFNTEHVRIGENSSINYFCQFYPDPDAYISIGDNCFVGMNVNFCTVSHNLGNSKQRAGENTYKPIVIGDGCWIGANSIILPGVTICSGTIIAAGSVVTRNCEKNSLYAGNPAKKIKDLS
jgi:maltose O-acetyltransferase